MAWDLLNDRPIYTQLVERIELRIVTGEYPPGSRLPSVRDLAAEAGVNPNTMQRALAQLEMERLVFSHRTSGRFVTEEREVIMELKNVLARNLIDDFLLRMGRLGYSLQETARLVVDASQQQENRLQKEEA